MAECPFCNGRVSETLVIHGGTCPNCFGDVPGEETPTDPGEEVKAELLQAHQEHARRQTRKPLLVLVPLVLAVVGFAGWSVFGPQPELPTLVLDDNFLDGVDFEFAEYKEPVEVVEPAAVASVRKTQRTKSGNRLEQQLRKGKGLAPAPNTTAQLTEGAVASADGGPRGRTASGADPRAGKMPNTITAMKVGSDKAGVMEPIFQPRRTAALLTKEDDIKRAIRALWQEKGPTLVQCYERRLKENEDLRGQWKIDFTIGTDGRISKAVARGVSMSDGSLESCITRSMGKWSIYGRLPKARSVTLPVKFGT